MSKIIEDKNFVPKERLKLYSEIDGLQVIEELLLFKGIEICAERSMGYVVSRKRLDQMALVHYGLSVNKTNQLYVGIHLDRYYRRADLVDNKHPSEVVVPKEIYIRVKTLNDSYKTNDNQVEE